MFLWVTNESCLSKERVQSLFDFPHGDSLDIPDILYVEGLRRNLISVSKLRDQKISHQF